MVFYCFKEIYIPSLVDVVFIQYILCQLSIKVEYEPSCGTIYSPVV